MNNPVYNVGVANGQDHNNFTFIGAYALTHKTSTVRALVFNTDESAKISSSEAMKMTSPRRPQA